MGKLVYYFSTPDYEKDFTSLYLVKADGTEKKHIKKLKHYMCFSGFYGNEIFYQRHRSYHNAECDWTMEDTYSYHINSGTITKVIENCCFLDSYRQYFIGRPNSGSYDPLPLSVYNAKTEQSAVITKNGLGSFLNGRKVYFAETVRKDGSIEKDGYHWKISIKTYDFKTKKRKIMVKKIKVSEIVKIGIDYVIYKAYDKQEEAHYYCYDFKTEERKIIENPYNNALSDT